jgi:hypothetical protein
MMSPALLTDVVLTSLESLAIVVGVALVRLGGVNFIFSAVSPNLTNFLVLPNPTPYLESELLSSYRHFCAFLLNFFNAFLSFSISLVSCVKFWLTEFAFLPPFLAAGKSNFSFPSFLNLQQSQVLCMVYVPPGLLHRLQCFLKRIFLGTLAVDSVPGCFFPFLLLGEAFSGNSNLTFSWVQTRLITSSEVRSKCMSIGIMPFSFMLYWSCHWIGYICSTWLPSSASVNGMFSGLVLAFLLEL